MEKIIYLILEIIPFVAVGLIVFYVTRVTDNKELRKATLEAYYKGKADGERAALKEQLDKLNGYQNQHKD